MAPTTITDDSRRPSKPPTAPAPGKSVTFTHGGLPPVEAAHLELLRLVAARPEPVTKGQIARLMNLPTEEVQSITGSLCDRRLLRRLNTIIESYVAWDPASS